MFVRKKRNKSGTISVVIVDKRNGLFREVRNLGTVKTEVDADALCREGDRWIRTKGGRQMELDLFPEERLLSSDDVFSSITHVRQDGAYRLLEAGYKRIGFDGIPDKVLKDLVIARVCEPKSKLATTDYIRRHWGEDYHYQQMYRYLDTLYDTQKETVQRISV